MEDLLKNRQVTIGLLVFVVGAVWLALMGMGTVSGTGGGQYFAIAAAMVGAMLVFLGMSIEGGKVEGMDEVYDVAASLREMRDELAAMIESSGDDKKDDD